VAIDAPDLDGLNKEREFVALGLERLLLKRARTGEEPRSASCCGGTSTVPAIPLLRGRLAGLNAQFADQRRRKLAEMTKREAFEAAVAAGAAAGDSDARAGAVDGLRFVSRDDKTSFLDARRGNCASSGGRENAPRPSFSGIGPHANYPGPREARSLGRRLPGRGRDLPAHFGRRTVHRS